MDSYIFWGVWILLLAGLYFLSSYLEKKAALRGSHRKPMPTWVDKSIRFFFLTLFMWPMTALLGFWPVFVMFAIYVPSYLDGSEKRGRESKWLKKGSIGGSIFEWIAGYFSCNWESEDGYVLKGDRKYVVGCHPHGLLPVGTMINVLSDVADMHNTFFGATKVRTLAASFCFLTPLYRDILVGGGVIDAARYNARAALDEGYSIALVPGGATEALYAMPGRSDVYIRRRKGFIKLAIETGSDLVPVYSFGESELYGQMSASFPFVQKIQKKFQAVFGISLPMITNILPRKVAIVSVAAHPITVKKNPNPTDAEINEVLEEYIKSLERVYYKFADKYGAKGQKLNIH